MSITMRSSSIIILALGVSVLLGIMLGLSRTSYKDPGMVGVVKQVYTKQRAVPNKYHEMKKIVEEFKKAQTWENVVEMGDIYARGFFPYLLPDEKMALQIYEVATRCPDPIVKGNAEAKITSMTNTPVSKQDREGQPMATSYGKSIVNFARMYIELHIELQQNPKPIDKNKNSDTPTELETRNSKKRKQLNKRIHPARNETARPGTPRPGTPRLGTQRHRIGGGNQNTHDHGVTSATKTNIKTLSREFAAAGREFRNHDVVLEEATKLCKNSADAHHVLATLSADEYSSTGVSQIQILDMVLWKISTIPDVKIQEGVKETLCKRLASGFENGIVVCGTGKVARIISVFEGVLENAQKSVSINLVEKEIAHMAVKIREDFLDSVGPVGRKAYESDNSVPEYSQAMSNNLRRRVKEEYVEKLSMNDSVINPLVQVYANAY